MAVLAACCKAKNSDCCQTGIWTDDQVWSLYFNVTTEPTHAAALWQYLESTPKDGLAVEGVPCRWTNISSSGRLSWSWFGRLGAGDILARFRWGKLPSAHRLMAKTAKVFAESGNIYESYNMSGGRAGDTGADRHPLFPIVLPGISAERTALAIPILKTASKVERAPAN